MFNRHACVFNPELGLVKLYRVNLTKQHKQAYFQVTEFIYSYLFTDFVLAIVSLRLATKSCITSHNFDFFSELLVYL